MDLTARDSQVRPGGTLRLDYYRLTEARARSSGCASRASTGPSTAPSPGPYWANFLPEIVGAGAGGPIPRRPVRYVLMGRDDLLLHCGAPVHGHVQRGLPQGHTFRFPVGLQFIANCGAGRAARSA